MKISGEIRPIPLKHIEISEFNVRLTDRKAGIEELAASIEKYGLLQPVVLMGTYGHPPYKLIVGQRRFLAHRFLKEENIPAVFSDRMTDVQAKILSLGENMQRVELNHADKAEAITALYIHYGKDYRRVARELGISLRTVRDYIRIDEMATPKAKNLLNQRKVSKADVKRVIDAAEGDADKADKLLVKISALSKYEKQRIVDYGRNHPKASAETIIAEGSKPKNERTVILNLSTETHRALEKAEEVLSMDRESIASKALSEWLTRNGFLK